MAGLVRVSLGRSWFSFPVAIALIQALLFHSTHAFLPAGIAPSHLGPAAPSSRPSSIPSSHPSSFPSVVDYVLLHTVTYTTIQRVEGISYDDYRYSSDPFISELALRLAIVETLQLRDVNDVSILSVTSDTRRLDEEIFSPKKLQSDGCVFTYDLVIFIGEGNSYTSADEAYETSKESLEVAVFNGWNGSQLNQDYLNARTLSQGYTISRGRPSFIGFYNNLFYLIGFL